MKRNDLSWVHCALSWFMLSGVWANELNLTDPGEGTILRPDGLPAVTNPEIPAQPKQFGSALSGIGGGQAASPNYQMQTAVGAALSSGAPDYLFGDVISPPLVDASGTQTLTPEEADAYWRSEPVRPGESVKTVDPTDNDLPVPAEFKPHYYYSPHGDHVLASHNGRSIITWRTRVPVDAQNHFETLTLTYKVASSTRLPVRRIYWTEGRYNGPAVTVPQGLIQDVTVVYNNRLPATVSDAEVKIPPSVEGGDLENRTFWFESGQGQLRAVNREGRVLVEYLGAARGAPGSGLRESLGVEVVQVSQETLPIEVETLLGERLLPKADGETVDARVDDLQPSQVDQTSVGQEQFVEQHTEQGKQVYYAVAENAEPLRVQFYWLEPGLKGVLWPTYLNSYHLTWPSDLAGYDARMVRPADAAESNGTFVSLPTGNTPELVYQDDRTNLQAALDFRQRLLVNLGESDANRSLVRFSSGNDFWYVRVFASKDDLLGNIDGTPGIDIQQSVSVGQRILPPAQADSVAGYIDTAYGTAYDPQAYIDPFDEAGVVDAERGAILPVNALPGNDKLRVWWFEEVTPPAHLAEVFESVYFPAYVGEYAISYPGDAPEIVLASNLGSGDLSPSVAVGEVYYQNDPTQHGYNPNEEHALMLGGRAYALRDDLNVPAVSSAPYALIRYEDTDRRPSMQVFKVLRETEDYQFRYPAVAGTLLQSPAPLPFIQKPLLSHGQSRNVEVLTEATDLPGHTAILGEKDHYDRFTFEDRKGSRWIYRGPHASDGSAPVIGMQYYYKTQTSFAFPHPTQGHDQAPELGTIVPYLRPLDETGDPVGDPIAGTPLTVRYEPQWPAQVPELRYGETLTLPKFGLPQVRGQKSVQVIYEGSLANDGTTSVKLYDPTRRKVYHLSVNGGELDKLPVSIATSDSRGKIYFQNLASHLQDRFYYDPLVGDSGALVLEGRFADEVAGEDYLLLNKLSNSDLQAVQDLCNEQDDRKLAWDTAVTALSTTVERFIENPSIRGTYYVDPAGDHQTSTSQEIPFLTSPPAKPLEPVSGPDGYFDEAVDSYALSAVGGGSGYVTLISGNGRAFTPEEEPVAVHILRVGGGLYQGELKPVVAANPLSENVTVQHTGDFAGAPEDYEFEWRKSPPVDGLNPDIYTLSQELLTTSAIPFAIRRDAVTKPDGSHDWTDTGTTSPLPASLAINAVANASGEPGLSLLGEVPIGASASGAQSVRDVYFALSTNASDGIIVMINDVEVIRYQIGGGQSVPIGTLPEDVESQLSGMDLVFAVDSRVLKTDGTSDVVELVYWSGTAAAVTTDLDFRIVTTLEEDITNANYSPVTSGPETGKNRHLVSGAGIDVLGDNYFIMRYRPKEGHELYPDGGFGADEGWSRWTRPALVEGWIKRVLAGINPFNQRLEDFFDNAINTDVSLISQAGTRWEGDIALTLDNVQDAGLIEIYETVLKRGVNLSISGTPAIDYAPANDALLLAAGYLADLYSALGDEAFADAANPTILIDTAAANSIAATSVVPDFESVFRSTATARFAFQGQMASLLDEEMALLRGRSDQLAPGVQISPAYNRLYWNYTRGIDAGEVIYALNYNINEKSGDNADGRINAEDAQRLFPQGHGDAYGHYLTALKNYYRLLANPNFTWGTRSETVNMLGQPVSVDYLDERKFVRAAAAQARTVEQIQSLEHRQAFENQPAAGWEHFRPGTDTDSLGRAKTWSLDDWSSRGGQSAYYHWVVGNALLPHEDTEHEGIQKIDRTTVPELDELAKHAKAVQERQEAADRGLNPLDLSSDSMVFDISPTEQEAGKTHFEQVYDRAVTALGNAYAVFDRAADSSRLLRAIENQDQLLNDAVVDQERAYLGQLKAIYGVPYAGDIGPGKTYEQGYDGPDLYRHFYLTRPFEIFSQDTLFPTTNGTRELTLLVKDDALLSSLSSTSTDNHSFAEPTRASSAVHYTIRDSDGPYQFASTSQGKRAQLGTLQESLADVRLKEEQLYASLASMDSAGQAFIRILEDFDAEIRNREESQAAKERRFITKVSTGSIQLVAKGIQDYVRKAKSGVDYFANAAIEGLPKVVGFSNDPTSTGRAFFLLNAATAKSALDIKSAVANGFEIAAEAAFLTVEEHTRRVIRDNETEDFFRAKSAKLRAEYVKALASMREVDANQVAYERALEHYRSERAKGDAILAERESFRKRAAAVVQGYRTRDVAFRSFRTEALEQYHTLFAQAARYAYLAAQAYDYETGLLGTDEGRRFLGKIVSSRALGLVDDDGQPSFAGSADGDAGLSGLLAKLDSNWSVAKGRLGFNNPDRYGTNFSLRKEAFRVPGTTEADRQWKAKLSDFVVPNLLADADVASHALQIDQDGTPIAGLILPFQTRIVKGQNVFGQPLAVGDHRFTESNFATKLHSVGIVFEGYKGMDPCYVCTPEGADGPDTSGHPDALAANPHVYLLPVGTDIIRTPQSNGGLPQREWRVLDHALPYPYDIGALASKNGDVSWGNLATVDNGFLEARRHQAFRAVGSVNYFYHSHEDEFTSTRLVGRSVENTQWKLVIPASELLTDESDGLRRFINSVTDIQVYFRTYSHAGN